MAGLESILFHIEEQAQISASAITEKANKQAEELIESKRAAAKAECEAIAEKAQQSAQTMAHTALSAARLECKKALLAKKSSLIDEIIDEALERMKNMPEKEYFDALLNLAVKHSGKSEGLVILSQKDKERLNGFEEALAEKTNGKLHLSDQTREMSGGFILSYGEIEENCTFEALLAERRDVIRDKINALIF